MSHNTSAHAEHDVIVLAIGHRSPRSDGALDAPPLVTRVRTNGSGLPDLSIAEYVHELGAMAVIA